MDEQSGRPIPDSSGDYSIKRLTGSVAETVLTDNRLRWPNTFSEGEEGTM